MNLDFNQITLPASMLIAGAIISYIIQNIDKIKAILRIDEPTIPDYFKHDPKDSPTIRMLKDIKLAKDCSSIWMPYLEDLKRNFLIKIHSSFKGEFYYQQIFAAHRQLKETKNGFEVRISRWAYIRTAIYAIACLGFYINFSWIIFNFVKYENMASNSFETAIFPIVAIPCFLLCIWFAHLSSPVVCALRIRRKLTELKME